MAATKPIIYKEIEITDAGGANAAQFDKHLVENASVTPTPSTSMVDDGQTLTDFYDVEFQADVYEASLLADARVYSDGGSEPVKADIIFKGAAGSQDLKIESVIINGNHNFEGNRRAVRITGTKRAVDLSDLLALSDPA